MDIIFNEQMVLSTNMNMLLLDLIDWCSKKIVYFTGSKWRVKLDQKNYYYY